MVATATADASGRAELTLSVPGGADGRTAWFQAVDRDQCAVTNLVEHTFGDDGSAVFDTDLVYPILVTVQCQEAAITAIVVFFQRRDDVGRHVVLHRLVVGRHVPVAGAVEVGLADLQGILAGGESDFLDQALAASERGAA